jgi:hypothetical protein
MPSTRPPCVTAQHLPTGCTKKSATTEPRSDLRRAGHLGGISERRDRETSDTSEAIVSDRSNYDEIGHDGFMTGSSAR